MQTNYVYQLAKPEDIEKIVLLFKLCLGTDGGAPTVAFWNWKHHQNPAGLSPVILAWDGDKLIGIRAFMCFKFHIKKGVYKAYRPVDTATHPEYQGKGIFKNLTLSLIEDLKVIDEKAFIFNTPNAQSKPGYIKMGWITWGKPLLQVMPSFALLGTTFKKDQVKLLCFDFSSIEPKVTERLTVFKDADYYRWRYQQIAIQQYGLKEIYVDKQKYLIIYRQKKVAFFYEFRVCDIIKNNVSCSEIPSSLVIKLVFNFGFGFLSFTNTKTFWLSLKLKNKAPLVTFRKIRDDDAVLLFNSVDWSIGELELF